MNRPFLNLNKVAVLGPEIARNIDELGLNLIEQRAMLADQKVYDGLLKELVMKYVDAERELNQANDLKNKFLGMAAHDLRSPLSGLRGLSEILLDMELGKEEQREFLQAIYDTSGQMLRLVSDLLDVSVIESGKLEMRPQQGSVGVLVRARLKLLLFAAEKKQIRVETAIDDSAVATFDADRLGQVVDNLVSNAIKFSPLGSVIHVAVTMDGESVRLSIRDSGPGLSAADQGKLFGAFQKLSARPTGGEQSTGLGLAIVKKIVEAHHGTVEVNSEAGQGTEFSVRIPAEGGI